MRNQTGNCLLPAYIIHIINFSDFQDYHKKNLYFKLNINRLYFLVCLDKFTTLFHKFKGKQCKEMNIHSVQLNYSVK